MSEEQNLQPETNAEKPEAGSEEEALQALAKAKGVVAEESNEESDTEADVDEETAEEEAEAEPEEADDGINYVDVEIDGETYQIPEKIKDGYLRQADFSRNMNEVSEKRKSAESLLESAQFMQDATEKFAEKYAMVLVAQSELQQYENIDWQRLRQDDEQKYVVLATDARSAQDRLDRASNEARAVFDEIRDAKGKSIETKREEMLGTLKKTIPNWGDSVGTEVTSYALSNGYSVGEVKSLTDARTVQMMYKAMKYDSLMKTKDGLKAKIKSSAPVLKPSSTKPNNARTEALVNFNKNRNSTDAAIAALSAARTQRRS